MNTNLLRVVVLLLVCLATGLSGCAMPPLQVAGLFANKSKGLESKMAAGLLCERQNKDEQALKIYESMLEKDPRMKGVQQRLGVLAAKRGDYEDAEKYFEKALAEGTPNAELLNDVGYNLFLQDKLEEAEELFRRALKRDPHFKSAHTNLGLVLGQFGKMDESLASFRKGGQEAEAQANLAYIYAQQNQLVQAQMHYSLALKADPDLRIAGEALLQLSNLNGADTRLAAATASATGEAPITPAAPLAKSKADIARSFDRGMGLVDIVDSARPAPQVAQLVAAVRVGKPDGVAVVPNTPEITKALESAAPAVPVVAAANANKARNARYIDRELELPEPAATKQGSGYRPSVGEATRTEIVQSVSNEPKKPIAAATPKVASPRSIERSSELPEVAQTAARPTASNRSTPAVTPPVTPAAAPAVSSVADAPPAPPSAAGSTNIPAPEVHAVQASRIPNIAPPNVLPGSTQTASKSTPSQVMQAAHVEATSKLPTPVQPHTPSSTSRQPSTPQSKSPQPVASGHPVQQGQVANPEAIKMPSIVIPNTPQPATPGTVTAHQQTKPAVRQRRSTTISAN